MRKNKLVGSKKEKVIVVVGSIYYADPLISLGLEITAQFQALKSIPVDQIGLVFFTGGEDVSPWLYKGKECGVSYVNPVRDRIEQYIFQYCIDNSIKTLGVCRGFQFLNVMCGGRMFQHLDHHGLYDRHGAYFPHLGQPLQVSSTHHQLVQLPDRAVPIAWSDPKRSKEYITADGEIVENEEGPEFEMEAAVFPDNNALGVQYHPEIMKSAEPGRLHFTDMVSTFLKIPMEEFVERYGRELKKNEPRQEDQAQGGGPSA